MSQYNFNAGAENRTTYEKNKKVIAPENTVMENHSMGDENIQQVKEKIVHDQITEKSNTPDSQLLGKSLVQVDGPQMEGMYAPIMSFENNALIRQYNKPTEIYGN